MINNKLGKNVGWFFYDQAHKTVLLHRRDHRAKDSPNMWDCFGGAQEEGEEPIQAFIRELHEELDIVVPESETRQLIEYDKKYIYYIFFSDWLTRSIKLGEGGGFAWFGIDEGITLPDLTTEAKEILEKFREKLSKDNPEDKRVLYQIATSNLAFFKTLMLNLTYYTLLIYGALLFVFEKISDKVFGKDTSWIVLLITGLAFMALAIYTFYAARKLVNKLHEDSVDERKRIKGLFGDLLRKSLLPSEADEKIRSYDDPRRDKGFIGLYNLTSCLGLVAYIILLLLCTYAIYVK